MFITYPTLFSTIALLKIIGENIWYIGVYGYIDGEYELHLPMILPVWYKDFDNDGFGDIDKFLLNRIHNQIIMFKIIAIVMTII